MLASDPTLIFSSRYDEGPQLWQRLAISGAQGPPCIPLCSASLLLPLALPFHQHVNMLKTLLSLKTLTHLGASLGVLWLRLCSPTAGAAGSIPGQGTKIPQSHPSSLPFPEKLQKELSILNAVVRSLERLQNSFQGHQQPLAMACRPLSRFHPRDHSLHAEVLSSLRLHILTLWCPHLPGCPSSGSFAGFLLFLHLVHSTSLDLNLGFKPCL